jgi:SAM-dependent methyltransferase
MLNTTLSHLKCPRRKRGHSCGATLELHPNEILKNGPNAGIFEVRSGHLKCSQCQFKFPILAGVAVLVDNVREYLLTHVKGIAQAVTDSEIPREYLHEFFEAKTEIQTEHIEEDLEAERVNALYLMNHYLRVKNTPSNHLWWRSQSGRGSPLIDSLIRQYWDEGPFAKIEHWVREKNIPTVDSVELGCGVGGLYSVLKPYIGSYLGVDSSFVSIAIGRHLALGVPYRGTLQIPEDLLQGPVSRNMNFPSAQSYDGRADLVVGDLVEPPLQMEKWELAITLNAIDMLDDPSSLPAIQHRLLKSGGIAIQSCPYIWHPEVSFRLQKRLPQKLRDSSSLAVEWLYQKAGFKIEEREEDIPWLFFKHIRQLEIYSVHAFLARKV